MKFHFKTGNHGSHASDLEGIDGAAIAALVQGNSNLNARLTVAGAANSFSATAKDSGQNFVMTATVTKTDAGAGTFDFGAATATAANTNPTSQTMNTKSGAYTGVAVTDWTPTRQLKNVTEINEVAGSTMRKDYYRLSTDREAGVVATDAYAGHSLQPGRFSHGYRSCSSK